MDYEKKYNEALEQAKKELATCGSMDCDAAKLIFRLFPQLRESEDERIRKEIIEHIKDQIDSFIAPPDCRDKYDEEELARYKSWIAYLEKQKEQKSTLTTERIRPKFAVGDTVCRPMWSEHTIREIYVRCDDPVYICVNEEGTESHILMSEQDEWERKEQKPVEWSKEDEKQLDDIISIIREAYEHGITISETRHRNAYFWLNELRPPFKPSEKQLDALAYAIQLLDDGLSPKAAKAGEELESLREQLKKL